MPLSSSSESERLRAHRAKESDWKKWGPYLAERAWGTVREDYSQDGEAWQYFSHEDAVSRVYRWNEDGLGGFSDRSQRLCLSLALWNEQDPLLKERLFGLSGPEGNHGEDVKEYYYYLDATPTHSYMKMLYKYPQRAFPYELLRQENRQRDRLHPEFELLDTGIFEGNAYFDVYLEVAKASPEELLLRITAWNRAPRAAPLHLLPQAFCRNTWSWDLIDEQREAERPILRDGLEGASDTPMAAMRLTIPSVGDYLLCCEGSPRLLFTENESNLRRLFRVPNQGPYVKDAFHDAVIRGRLERTNPARVGTKACAWYHADIPAGGHLELRLRLVPLRTPLTEGWLEASASDASQVFADFDAVLAQRKLEADEFYRSLQPKHLSEDQRLVQRQAFAGLLWSKQWYHYDVERWLKGDSRVPPPEARARGRNSAWTHMNVQDILSMPDKWEYPWFAAWDLAFHCLPLALIDPDFAKRQLILMVREWYMHPNGQLPAYEWNFSDVNPPVHAWAAWQVFQLEKRYHGVEDHAFLERIFHKLLLNFTWWVNRKDTEGKNVFQGGFLGLDNIGVFDRSKPLPTGGSLEQSDSTSWMGMYALNLMTIALELARHNPAYEDVATKFFEHFMYIAHAMNNMAGEGIELWDPFDEFPYDVLHLGPHQTLRLKVRSMVGLIPLFAVETIDPEQLSALPSFRRRMEWFLTHRPELARLVSRWTEPGAGSRHLLALMRGHRMKRILKRMLDPEEFLSPFGVRALSRAHRRQPYVLRVRHEDYRVDYEPAESQSGLFGGNSNWRGPIWFPVNFLVIEALKRFHQYYSDDFRIECPTGSGRYLNLLEVSQELSRRLTAIFLRNEEGRRPVFGRSSRFQTDAHFRDHVLFYEYFHGDTGEGLGASHQTGWTALVASLLQESP